jgi:hypothetical protein
VRALAVALLLLLAAPAAQAQLLDCRGGQKPSQIAELWFGRKIGDRIGVSDTAFRRFVDGEITPRFPDGLTVFNATGQYRDRDSKRLIREPSKIVHLVLSGEPDEFAKLNAIAEVYKTRFKQQSVAIIVRPACVSF